KLDRPNNQHCGHELSQLVIELSQGPGHLNHEWAIGAGNPNADHPPPAGSFDLDVPVLRFVSHCVRGRKGPVAEAPVGEVSRAVRPSDLEVESLVSTKPSVQPTVK